MDTVVEFGRTQKGTCPTALFKTRVLAGDIEKDVTFEFSVHRAIGNGYSIRCQGCLSTNAKFKKRGNFNVIQGSPKNVVFWN